MEDKTKISNSISIAMIISSSNNVKVSDFNENPAPTNIINYLTVQSDKVVTTGDLPGGIGLPPTINSGDYATFWVEDYSGNIGYHTVQAISEF